MNFDKLGIPKAELTAEQESLLAQLEPFAPQSSEIKEMIEGVRYGFFNAAKNICESQLDKLRDVSDAFPILEDLFYPDNEETPWTRVGRSQNPRS